MTRRRAHGRATDPRGDRAATAQVDAGKHQVPTRPMSGAAAVPGPQPTPVPPRAGTGLCLSGGGYRAAVFHLGALRRLDELGILGRLRTVTGVSGGSLAAAMLEHPDLGWPRSGDDRTRVDGFEELVADPLRRLVGTNTRTPAVLSRLLPWRWTVLDGAVRELATRMTKVVPWWATPLRDLVVAGPAVVVVATELGYGIDWHFRDPTSVRPHGLVGDYRLGFAEPPAWLTVADAVATSCAYPPVFSPRLLDGRELGLVGGTPGTESEEVRATILRRIGLSDGGVYDNLGVEPVWKDHANVLVSDGGPVFRPRTTRSPVGRVVEAIGLAADASTSVRLRWLHTMMATDEIGGATWSVDTALPGLDADLLRLLARVRTDLDAFSQVEQQVLERHGYLVAETVVRRHAPELVAVDAPAVAPHPDVPHGEELRGLLADAARRTVLGRW